MISIIIPVKNELYYTKQILEEIESKVKSEYEIIIVNDHSTDDTEEWLNSYASNCNWVKKQIFHNVDSNGVNASWNLWVSQAKWEYIWIINNDLILTEWVDLELISLLETYKIACPISTRGKEKFSLPVIKTLWPNIAGWCFMMKKENWIPIDSRLDIWFGDNWAYETNDRSVWFKWLIHHFESKTLKNPETIANIQKRINRDKLAWEVIKDEHPEWWKVKQEIVEKQDDYKIKLSILIPSLPSRYNKLGELMEILEPQLTDEVELIVYTDNKKITIWEKRNKLLAMANGKYVAMIDDDDEITENYVGELLKWIKSDCDVVCFKIQCSIEWWEPKPVFYSKNFQNEDTEDGYYRKPNHLMCIKREIARAVWYENINFGEDTYFSEKVTKLIKTEYFIDKFLYTYKYFSATSECK